MSTPDIGSSSFLQAIRWPAIALAAICGLTPHILLLNHSAAQRLTMIIVMHALIVPSFAAFALLTLERRARRLEEANDRLRRTADDLTRKCRQHEALSSVVRLLAAAPSVSAVAEPLARIAREALRADRLHLTWTAPGFDRVEVDARPPGAATPPTAADRILPLREGGTDLGAIRLSAAQWDSYDETTLSILTSEIRLRWRLRHVEANALSALYAAEDGNAAFEAARQTRRLLAVLCEAAGAEGAALYLHGPETWMPRVSHGTTRPLATEMLDHRDGLWQLDGGATVCINGAQDGVLVLQCAPGRAIDTAALNQPLAQMIAGHSATLMRVIDGYQQLLWRERQRVSQELHDEVCQSIASVHMQLGHLETLISEGRPAAPARCRQLREAALDAYEATRMAVDGFRQKPGPDETAAAFLERMARAACRQRGLELAFRAGPVALDPEAAWQLGRVLQEAVANAARHGGATRVKVRLGREGAALALTVVDNGQPAGAEGRPGGSGSHHGLKIMAERAEELGGEFSISYKSTGTEVKVVLPSPDL